VPADEAVGVTVSDASFLLAHAAETAASTTAATSIAAAARPSQRWVT
jgi:hypothetical protein